MTTGLLNQLPNRALQEIFSYLSFEQLGHNERISKKIYHVIRSMQDPAKTQMIAAFSHLPEELAVVLHKFFKAFVLDRKLEFHYRGPEQMRFSSVVELKSVDDKNTQIAKMIFSTKNESLDLHPSSIMEVDFQEKNVLYWRQGVLDESTPLKWIKENHPSENLVDELVSLLEFWDAGGQQNP